MDSSTDPSALGPVEAGIVDHGGQRELAARQLEHGVVESSDVRAESEIEDGAVTEPDPEGSVNS